MLLEEEYVIQAPYIIRLRKITYSLLYLNDRNVANEVYIIKLKQNTKNKILTSLCLHLKISKLDPISKIKIK